MIEKRHIEIKSGNLAIGSESLFSEIAEAETVYLYVDNADSLEVSAQGTTSIRVAIAASELDLVAGEWSKMRVRENI